MGKIDSAIPGGNGNLDDFRKEIDKIDKEIISLLSRRMELSRRIGKLKHRSNLPLFDPGREETLLKKLVNLNRSPFLTPTMLRSIYREILAASRSLQYPVKIAYLGPDWTYSHIAALDFFGHEAEYCSCKSISEIFDRVQRRQCDIGVVPVESSLEGSIGVTIDLLYEYNLYIVRECYVAMEYSLASSASSLDKIKEVYAHPRSFNLCRSWLSEHLKGVAFLECPTTSEAARLCKERPESAALCNMYAAHHFGLNILVENVADFPDAYTRFFALSRSKTSPSGDDKTSVIFATYNMPGALYDALEPFAKRGVNLVRIESRISKHWMGSYLFFADLEGHENSQEVKTALEEMVSKLPFVKVLGSYPRAFSDKPIRINKEAVRSRKVGCEIF